MNKNEFLRLINNINPLDSEQLSAIKGLMRLYPYFQAPFVLNAKTTPTAENITKAATRTLDRVVLKKLLEADFSELGNKAEVQDFDLNTDDINIFEKLAQQDDLQTDTTNKENEVYTEPKTELRQYDALPDFNSTESYTKIEDFKKTLFDGETHEQTQTAIENENSESAIDEENEIIKPITDNFNDFATENSTDSTTNETINDVTDNTQIVDNQDTIVEPVAETNKQNNFVVENISENTSQFEQENTSTDTEIIAPIGNAISEEKSGSFFDDLDKTEVKVDEIEKIEVPPIHIEPIAITEENTFENKVEAEVTQTEKPIENSTENLEKNQNTDNFFDAFDDSITQPLDFAETVDTAENVDTIAYHPQKEVELAEHASVFDTEFDTSDFHHYETDADTEIEAHILDVNCLGEEEFINYDALYSDNYEEKVESKIENVIPEIATIEAEISETTSMETEANPIVAETETITQTPEKQVITTEVSFFDTLDELPEDSKSIAIHAVQEAKNILKEEDRAEKYQEALAQIQKEDLNLYDHAFVFDDEFDRSEFHQYEHEEDHEHEITVGVNTHHEHENIDENATLSEQEHLDLYEHAFVFDDEFDRSEFHQYEHEEDHLNEVSLDVELHKEDEFYNFDNLYGDGEPEKQEQQQVVKEEQNSSVTLNEVAINTNNQGFTGENFFDNLSENNIAKETNHLSLQKNEEIVGENTQEATTNLINADQHLQDYSNRESIVESITPDDVPEFDDPDTFFAEEIQQTVKEQQEFNFFENLAQYEKMEKLDEAYQKYDDDHFGSDIFNYQKNQWLTEHYNAMPEESQKLFTSDNNFVEEFWNYKQSVEQQKQFYDEKKKEQATLIDKFLEETPQLHIDKQRMETEQVADLSETNNKSSKFVVSEQLALIFARQGKKNKAISIYEKLALKYPEKSAYFAAQIENLK